MCGPVRPATIADRDINGSRDLLRADPVERLHRPADAGFRANTGRKSAHLGTSACGQEQMFGNVMVTVSVYSGHRA